MPAATMEINKINTLKHMFEVHDDLRCLLALRSSDNELPLILVPLKV